MGIWWHGERGCARIPGAIVVQAQAGKPEATVGDGEPLGSGAGMQDNGLLSARSGNHPSSVPTLAHPANVARPERRATAPSAYRTCESVASVSSTSTGVHKGTCVAHADGLFTTS